jgi:hypothetical protein
MSIFFGAIWEDVADVDVEEVADEEQLVNWMN